MATLLGWWLLVSWATGAALAVLGVSMRRWRLNRLMVRRRLALALLGTGDREAVRRFLVNNVL